ncbi:MAG: MerR family transcriptional regulator [Deinococcota bacterium]
MIKGKYTVNEVEERTKVPASTLRQWERRYDFPKPERSDSGYRLYSDKDLRDIDIMKRHIAEGIPASRAAELVKKLDVATPGPRSLATMQEELVEALIQLDDARADRIFSEAHALHTVDAVMLELMQKSMADIEHRLNVDEISITTEHFARNYIYGRLHALLSVTANILSGLVVIIACAPTEHRELSPLILSVSLRRAGYRVFYLGANTPIGDLHDMAKSLGSTGVIIAAASDNAWQSLWEYRGIFDSMAPIVAFCGPVFDKKAELAGALGGISLDSDPTAAVTRFHALVQNMPSSVVVRQGAA